MGTPGSQLQQESTKPKLRADDLGKLGKLPTIKKKILPSLDLTVLSRHSNGTLLHLLPSRLQRGCYSHTCLSLHVPLLILLQSPDGRDHDLLIIILAI